MYDCERGSLDNLPERDEAFKDGEVMLWAQQ
jgi:hypothetical protein